MLESKMAELNQNRNLWQPGWPDSVWKLYFILGINHIQLNCLHIFYKMAVLSKKTWEKDAKLVSAYEKLF